MTEGAQSRYWAVVPAAGTGARMAAGYPKQYMQLSGATVIEHTLSAFLQCGFIERVLVALNEDDRYWQDLPIAEDPKIQVVSGGAERCDSVLAGLLALENRAGENDWVLVHDAARPCITQADLETLRETLKDDSVGGLLALPVADTVKRVDREGRVECTLDRSTLWLAQTPQMFRYGLLRKALQQALGQGQQVTDEAAAIEFSGNTPRVVQGSVANLKLTRPEDLALAADWLKRRKS